MKLIGAGLSKTGTTSLHRALEMVGFKGIDYDQTRLNDILDGTNPNPDFRRYDDVDFVTDLPAAYFYREFLEAYPKSKAILTVRNADSWWKSVQHHWEVRYPFHRSSFLGSLAGILGWNRRRRKSRLAQDMFRRRLRNTVYGSVVASEFLYKKKFIEHNASVQATVPAHRLLVLDITRGDGWEKLCPFLGIAVPKDSFPHEHRGQGIESGIDETPSG